MRVEAGCFKTREGRDGSRVYLHRLVDGPRPEANLPPQPGPEAKRTDPDTLHSIYSALLKHLPLSATHREALQRRGLTEGKIEQACYRTFPGQGRTRITRNLHECFGNKLLRVPGFVVKEGRSGRYLTLRGPAGLIVPCRERAGRIVALKVRRDDVGEGSPRYLYCSSAGHGGPGPGAPVHFPAGTPEAAGLVRLTEGELKADVVQALTGLPTLSIPGVATWRPALEVLKAMGCQTVRLAFDADAPDNATVARALSACANALVETGFALELERWAAVDGKGLDDLLAAGKTPEVLVGDKARSAIRETLAAATAEEEPAPPDELARLQDVLDAGGAEALFRDRALMQALADLAGADPTGFAAVRASIRERVSLRDLDKALRPFRRPAVQPEVGEGPTYFEQNGCIYRTVQTKDGPVPVGLCNFSARLVEDVLHDDGAEQARYLAVLGKLADGSVLSRTDVPACDFARMDWLVPAWGTGAVVYAGMGTKDHLRVALQLLSGDVPRRTVFRHVGWRKVGERWLYLHAGGAVGAEGLIDAIPVSLPEPLAGFHLPAPPEGAELTDSVRASLRLLRLGPDRLTFPLLSAVYRAVLGDTDFALHLSGPTGCFKSEVAALAQQHFGLGMDARHLPANWSSTGNALEVLAFTAKDALLVVDDFCPTGSGNDVQRYHKEADRLLRGQGNRAGRQRLRADASLRPTKPPRGLTLSTGEDAPRGQSLRARLLVLEVSPGDFGPQPPDLNPRLSACQQDAAAGLYAKALAGFLRWLAPQLDAVRARQRGELAELRDRARGGGQHARTPGIVADLALGLRYLLEFALSTGAISDKERAELWRQGWEALVETGSLQAAHLATAEPAGQFLRLLFAALASGHAHVADQEGNEPDEPQRWGWRPEEYYVGQNGTATRSKPQGDRVGWLVDGELYLEPDASFATVQRFAREQIESFAITAHTLRRRLKEKGFLAMTDVARGKLTVRKTLQGERRDVLHIALAGAPPAPRNDADRSEHESAGKNGPEPRAGSWAENGQASGKSTQPTAAAGIQKHSQAGVGPEVGRLGRSSAEEDETAEANNSGQRANEWGNWL
jgi:hypothetical protein